MEPFGSADVARSHSESLRGLLHHPDIWNLTSPDLLGTIIASHCLDAVYRLKYRGAEMFMSHGMMVQGRGRARTDHGPIRGMGRAIRVLVVDDHYETRSLLEAAIGVRGIEVIVAADGLEAMKLLRTESFNLVVCDLDMPFMGGFELLQSLRMEAHPLAGRFLFLTGTLEGHPARPPRGNNNPPIETKPFALATLIDRIEQMARS